MDPQRTAFWAFAGDDSLLIHLVLYDNLEVAEARKLAGIRSHSTSSSFPDVHPRP